MSSSSSPLRHRRSMRRCRYRAMGSFAVHASSSAFGHVRACRRAAACPCMRIVSTPMSCGPPPARARSTVPLRRRRPRACRCRRPSRARMPYASARSSIALDRHLLRDRASSRRICCPRRRRRAGAAGRRRSSCPRGTRRCSWRRRRSTPSRPIAAPRIRAPMAMPPQRPDMDRRACCDGSNDHRLLGAGRRAGCDEVDIEVAAARVRRCPLPCTGGRFRAAARRRS